MSGVGEGCPAGWRDTQVGLAEAGLECMPCMLSI